MKKVLLGLLVIGFLSCGCEDEVTPNDELGFTIDCLSTNLQKDVIAFYPFSNGSLEDNTAESHDLLNTTSAAPTEDRDGNSKCAYIFDNASSPDEFLTTADSDFLDDLSEFSISLWYQPLNKSIQGQNIQGMFSRGNKTRCPNRMGEWSASLFDCRIAVFGHDNSAWADSVTDFSDGCVGEVEALVDKWHHFVGIKNGNDYMIYFNGVLTETKTGDASCGNFQAAQNIGDVFVGYNFTGRIDDIILYKRELSQMEVEELFELEACCN